MDCMFNSFFESRVLDPLKFHSSVQIWSLLQGSFAKETYNFKEPTN